MWIALVDVAHETQPFLMRLSADVKTAKKGTFFLTLQHYLGPIRTTTGLTDSFVSALTSFLAFARDYLSAPRKYSIPP
jgi:hypothetical protein